MSSSMLLRLGLAAGLAVSCAGALPQLRPRKNTIACADPLAAQDFTLKYIGGLWTEQLVDGGDGSCATIKWVNFSPDDPKNVNNTQFQWHFVETSRKATGPLSLVQLHGYQEWLHGNLSEAANPADELADMHMTLAAGSLDPFAALYHRDGVPFSPRARFIPAENLTLYSVLVEIPHGILAEVVSDHFSTYDGPTVAAPDLDCAPRKIPTANAASPARVATHPDVRRVPGALASRVARPGADLSKSGARRYFAHLRTLKPYSAENLPPIWPYSMSYASTQPAAAAAYVERYMGGAVVDQELPPACADTIAIGLNHFPNPTYPFYVQWLHHPKAKKGYFGLRGVEDYLTALHGNLTEDRYDQYMDDHLGMESVVRGDASFGAFIDEWRAGGVEWFHRMAAWDGVDSFLEAPGGVILETMVAKANGSKFDLPVVNWDICSPLPTPLPKLPLPGNPQSLPAP